MNQNNRFTSRNVETFADQIRRARIAKQNRNLKNFFFSNGIQVNSTQRSRRQFTARREENNFNRRNFDNNSNRRQIFLNRAQNNYNPQIRIRNLNSNPRTNRRQRNPQSINNNNNNNNNSNGYGNFTRNRQRIGFINRSNQNRNGNRQITYRNYNNFSNGNQQNPPKNSNQMKRGVNRLNRRGPKQRSQANKLSIENIAVDANNNELAEIFSPYGKIVKCSIIYDENNRSTGKGIVEFDSIDASKLAKNDLNGKKEIKLIFLILISN